MEKIKYRRDLHRLLPKEPVIAEIGVAEGYFSADMLSWGGKVYMVDVWETSNFPGDAGSDQQWHNLNYQAAMSRVKKYGDKAIVLRGPSVRMAQYVPDHTLDMVYLDACHAYQCVLDDLNAWFGKVKAGGLIAGHDYMMPQYGVYDAVNLFCSQHNFRPVTIVEDKNEDAGFYFVKA